MSNENNKAQLILFLKELDKAIDYEVTILAFGGTALSLLDTKEVSEDVDFIVKVENQHRDAFFEEFFKMVKKIGIQYGMNPPFDDFDLSLFKMPDYLKRSKKYDKEKFKHITLMIMDVYDILLSKINRYAEKDQFDFNLILNTMNISRGELYARYTELFRAQERDVRSQFHQQYQKFVKNFGGLLK